MIREYRGSIPYLFGVFVILAMLPQILGFNGTLIDDVFKIVLIGVLILKVSNSKFSRVTLFTGIYIILSFICTILIIICNDCSITTEVVNLIISILLVYTLIEAPQNTYSTSIDEIMSFYRLYAYFMTVACVYNMIINFNSLIHITSTSLYTSEAVSSFFDNKNTFGAFLMFGVLASSVLKILTKEKRWSLVSVVFLINEIMAMCRTGIVLSVVIIGLSFFADKQHRIKRIILLLILLSVVAMILSVNSKMNTFIFGTLFGSQTSMDARNRYVENLLPLAKGVHLWVGYGTSNALSLAQQYAGNQYYHNGYLKLLMSGGVFKCFQMFIAVAFSINCGFKCLRTDKSVGILCLISTAVFLIYNFAEAVLLFDKTVIAIVAVMFIISMPILFNKCIQEKMIYEEG